MNTLSKINHSQTFGVPIFEVDIQGFPDHQAALIEGILALQNQDSGTKVSNRGGWHSKNDFHHSDNPDFRWLCSEILKISRVCISRSNTMPEGARIGIGACWANVNQAGDWNAPHAHFPSDWSGVCYVQVNRQNEETQKSRMDGDILFFDPLPLGPQYRRFPTISRRPENGKMFLFPSYLVHMVAPHFEADPRISVAFNIKAQHPHQQGGKIESV